MPEEIKPGTKCPDRFGMENEQCIGMECMCAIGIHKKIKFKGQKKKLIKIIVCGKSYCAIPEKRRLKSKFKTWMIGYPIFEHNCDVIKETGDEKCPNK
jgi:hypothetical protein